MDRPLDPCPVCRILPIPKGHVHYAEDLANWHPAQPPFNKPLDTTSTPT
jgi:hypothetical protein